MRQRVPRENEVLNGDRFLSRSDPRLDVLLDERTEARHNGRRLRLAEVDRGRGPRRGHERHRRVRPERSVGLDLLDGDRTVGGGRDLRVCDVDPLENRLRLDRPTDLHRRVPEDLGRAVDDLVLRERVLLAVDEVDDPLVRGRVERRLRGRGLHDPEAARAAVQGADRLGEINSKYLKLSPISRFESVSPTASSRVNLELYWRTAAGHSRLSRWDRSSRA